VNPVDVKEVQPEQKVYKKVINRGYHAVIKWKVLPAVPAVSDDNEIFAINSDTGDVLWTYQAIIETARMLTSPSPAIVDDVVIAPFSSGEIVALKAQNGGVLWQDIAVSIIVGLNGL